MNVKLLFSALYFGLAFSPLFSQTFRPLSGYDQLLEPVSGKPRSLDKMACEAFDLSGINVVLPGNTSGIKLRPDTVALDGIGFNNYRCEGCDELDFGSAFLRNDSLFYGANAGAEFGLDTVSITACDDAGTCSMPLRVVILVRRAGREISLGALNLAPRARTEVVVPDDVIPGGATCRDIESCSVNYPGRSQRFDFLTGDIDNGNDFFYEASGFSGTDVVCVTLCNDFGLCDVYKSTFSIAVPSVDLPFFDDFSYEGVRPDQQLWQDEDVLVNRNFAQNPPSIGVATFDGVDFDGKPYPTGSGGRTTVIRDYLTSAPVNLAGRAGTTLSFYVQPRGFGNRPERQDSFLVQFLDQEGSWNTVFGREGVNSAVPGNRPIPFVGQTLNVPATYLYNGFQFRFAAKSSEQGAVDMWHLDYVKLGEGLALSTPDVALTELPGYLLRPPYISMPLRHLQAGGDVLLADSFRIAVSNNATQEVLTIESSESQFAVINVETNSQARQNLGTLFPDFGAAGGGNAVPSDTLIRRGVPFTNLDSDNQTIIRNFLFNATEEDSPLKLDLLYDLTVGSQDNDFADGALLDNDVLTSRTCLDEFMAYDDGSAELTIEVQEGTTILQRYEAFIADELTGIRIRIPRGLGGLGDQQLQLVVYAGESEPEELIGSYDFDILYAESFFRDSLQGYTTYVLPEPLSLPVGSFYVGWQQQRANRRVGIGYDRNNTPEDVQWFNTGGGWERLRGTITGAIMIRPLLSGFTGNTTSIAAPFAEEPLIDVYPNPTNGTLHLRPRLNTGSAPLSYRLYSTTGALLGANKLTDRLQLGHLPAGLYLLEVTNGLVSSRHKIIRR